MFETISVRLMIGVVVIMGIIYSSFSRRRGKLIGEIKNPYLT
tara:strand:+ start:237 stop:362 length:126 start_codon:yes stop_codon:yes gene_type:complete